MIDNLTKYKLGNKLIVLIMGFIKYVSKVLNVIKLINDNLFFVININPILVIMNVPSSYI